MHNILGNTRDKQKHKRQKSPLVSQVNIVITVSLHIFLAFLLFVYIIQNFIFPRTKAAKSVCSIF